MPATLMINEIFYSVQGESTWAGWPCVFVRLTGCHLRCHYCDTEYAFTQGRRMGIDQILTEAQRQTGAAPCPLWEVTGGEPLLQQDVHRLMTHLCDAGKTVLLETSGACDISTCDSRVIRILDLKTPGSGEVERNLLSNLEHLALTDEIKFVITGETDFLWAKDMVLRHELDAKVHAVLFSPVTAIPASNQIAGCADLLSSQLAHWLQTDAELAGRVRLQSQMHKQIWPGGPQGV